MSTHSKWVNGNLVFYSGHRKRWIDAKGPNVMKWELPIDIPHNPSSAHSSSDGGLNYVFQPVVTTSSDTSAYVAGIYGNAAPYRLRFSTEDSDKKYAQIQAKTFPFKLEASMPLYFGVKCKINSATSTDFFAGLVVDKSGTVIGASHAVTSSMDGVYFYKTDAATTVTPFTASSSASSVSSTSTKTMTSSAMTWEFHWDGSTTLTFFASGAQLGTCTSNIDQTANLGFSLGIGAGKSAHQTLDVEWARVIQLRT